MYLVLNRDNDSHKDIVLGLGVAPAYMTVTFKKSQLVNQLDPVLDPIQSDGEVHFSRLVTDGDQRC